MTICMWFEHYMDICHILPQYRVALRPVNVRLKRWVDVRLKSWMEAKSFILSKMFDDWSRIYKLKTNYIFLDKNIVAVIFETTSHI